MVQFNVAAMYGAVRTKLYKEGMHRHRAALALEAELRLRGNQGRMGRWISGSGCG